MSDSTDIFSASTADQTRIIPNPGGVLPSSSQSGMGRRPPAHAPQENIGAAKYNFSESAPAVSGINSLVAAANPLLDIVPQLRATLQHNDVLGLRDYLAQNIKTFESRAKAAGVTPEKIIAGRYVLCTLLDETAASTPWGESGIWAEHSLLVMFHRETYGGEKFFQLLGKLAENATANRDLLELMCICLALGFEGRYKVDSNGRAQLETIRERVTQIIRRTQGEYERDLSPHWHGVNAQRSKVLNVLPLWVAAAVCSLAMLVVYLIFNYKLNNISDPVFAQIQAIRVVAPAPKPVASAPLLKPRLATFLAKEIQEGLVTVADDDRKSVVTIRGDGLFQPASATILTNYIPLVARIGEALNGVQGHVQITGHTDNQPIRSMRFPSNWHLSQERARSVMQLLANKVPAERLSADGRADGEPVASNNSMEGRARNRRVEITLFVGGKGL